MGDGKQRSTIYFLIEPASISQQCLPFSYFHIFVVLSTCLPLLPFHLDATQFRVFHGLEDVLLNRWLKWKATLIIFVEFIKRRIGLNGMAVFRRDACGIMTVLMAYAALIYSGYVVVMWIIIRHLDGRLVGLLVIDLAF